MDLYGSLVFDFLEREDRLTSLAYRYGSTGAGRTLTQNDFASKSLLDL
jgi:hypothetical protein